MLHRSYYNYSDKEISKSVHLPIYVTLWSMLYWPDPSFYLCDAQFPQFCPLVNIFAELLSIALMHFAIGLSRCKSILLTKAKCISVQFLWTPITVKPNDCNIFWCSWLTVDINHDYQCQHCQQCSEWMWWWQRWCGVW